MYTVVFIRHGQSAWNLENRFTGWVDVDLSEQGVAEADEAAKLLIAEGFDFDLCYTSYLKRAIKTLHQIQDRMDLLWLPVLKSWRLNERFYGGLQGLNKTETAKKYGEEQVHIWRRSFDVPPPAIDPVDPMFPGNQPRYADIPKAELPLAESLKETIARVLPFWNAEVAPAIKAGRKILLAAHGNSIRALVKHLDEVSEKDILELNIPTGVPLVYTLDADLKPLGRRYLGDADAVAAKAAAVANQGKA